MSALPTAPSTPAATGAGWRWPWPRSLVGRVYALYSFTLLAIVGLGLGLFYRYQFDVEMSDAQLRADAMVAVLEPMLVDSAVIGDYDTIRRMLERAAPGSHFESVSYIDLKGGRVQASRREPLPVEPPQWLQQAVAQRLYDSNLPITAGGQDYGVLRLTFASDRIAAGLWQQTRIAVGLGLVGLVLGLVLIRWPLVRWLGHLSSVQKFEQALVSDGPAQALPQAVDTPTEFLETFAVLGRAAANLQAQRAQAAVTLGAIADAVFTLDREGRVVFTNPAARHLASRQGMGVILGETIGDMLPSLFTPGTALRPWSTRRSVIPAQGLEFPEVVVDSRLSEVLDIEGRVAGYVLTCHDVSEQHKLHQRLKEELSQRESALVELRAALESLAEGRSAARPSQDDLTAISEMISALVRQLKTRGDQLDAIFALSPDGFISFDGHHRVNYVSPAFTRLTGLGEAELLGQGESVVEDRLAALQDAARPWAGFHALRRHARQRHQGRNTKRDTIEVFRPSRAVLEVGLRESASEAVSQVLSLRDVTHETLVDQMKSEFLSMAAHELRTPMASIFGFTELLMRRRPTPEKQAEILETVHRQSQRMITIINELLDLARIESRRGLDFVLDEVDLVELLPQWIHDFKPPQDRQGPQLECELPQARVRLDKQKMEQALNNVLSNAYKYSPSGDEVRVRIVCSADSGQSPGAVGIEVVDHGIGLTPEQLKRVGERFWRADASGNIPGTGLGMTIVKEITELHGGSLQLQSEPGRGTTVTLWLPRLGSTPVAGSPALGTGAPVLQVAA